MGDPWNALCESMCAGAKDGGPGSGPHKQGSRGGRAGEMARFRRDYGKVNRAEWLAKKENSSLKGTSGFSESSWNKYREGTYSPPSNVPTTRKI